jgi:hypothetical protein
MKKLLIVGAIFILAFLAGRKTVAAKPNTPTTPATSALALDQANPLAKSCSVPKSYGPFRSASETQLFFEDANGTISALDLAQCKNGKRFENFFVMRVPG